MKESSLGSVQLTSKLATGSKTIRPSRFYSAGSVPIIEFVIQWTPCSSSPQTFSAPSAFLLYLTLVSRLRHWLTVALDRVNNLGAVVSLSVCFETLYIYVFADAHVSLLLYFVLSLHYIRSVTFSREVCRVSTHYTSIDHGLALFQWWLSPTGCCTRLKGLVLDYQRAKTPGGVAQMAWLLHVQQHITSTS